MGAVADDGPFYYRVHSPVVLIEFDHHPGVAFDNVLAIAQSHSHRRPDAERRRLRSRSTPPASRAVRPQHRDPRRPAITLGASVLFTYTNSGAAMCGRDVSPPANYGRLCMAVHKGTHRQRPHFMHDRAFPVRSGHAQIGHPCVAHGDSARASDVAPDCDSRGVGMRPGSAALRRGRHAAGPGVAIRRHHGHPGRPGATAAAGVAAPQPRQGVSSGGCCDRVPFVPPGRFRPRRSRPARGRVRAAPAGEVIDVHGEQESPVHRAGPARQE